VIERNNRAWATVRELSAL